MSCDVGEVTERLQNEQSSGEEKERFFNRVHFLLLSDIRSEGSIAIVKKLTSVF